jgi:hypothetical protein
VSDDHFERLLAHLYTLPDPKEAFGLLNLLREMRAITAEEASLLMHEYWELG